MKPIRILKGTIPIFVEGKLTIYGPGDIVKDKPHLESLGDERIQELALEGILELGPGTGEVPNQLTPAEKNAITNISEGLIQRSRALFNLAERARLAADTATVAPREPLVAPSGAQQRS
jgi:hypothetical protein